MTPLDPSTCDHDVTCATCGTRWPPSTGHTVRFDPASMPTDALVLQRWVRDLQSGMSLNCVYCGFRHEGRTDVPAVDALTAHVQVCPHHPLAALRRAVRQLLEAERLVDAAVDAYDAVREQCPYDDDYDHATGRRRLHDEMAGLSLFAGEAHEDARAALVALVSGGDR